MVHGVVDWRRLDADPDPNFLFDADPDPTQSFTVHVLGKHFLLFLHSSASEHCFIFLFSVIGVIFFNIITIILYFLEVCTV